MPQVGFIGAGAMGFPLIRSLLAAGIKVQVFDTSPAALRNAKEAGATVAESVKVLADENEIVFACLPTPAICKAVALESGGVIEGRKVRFYIEMSTIGGDYALEIAQQLAERGITLIDCPVVGGAVALEAGTIGILVACPEEAFQHVRYVLEPFGGRIFYLGANAGMAQVGKVMNNAVAHTAFLATCEAVAFGLKGGIDMETAVAIINQGSGRNFFSELVFPGFILKGRYDGTGAMEIGVKDVALFIKEAERLGMPVPMATRANALQDDVLSSGPVGRDTLTALHYFTDLAGLRRPS